MQQINLIDPRLLPTPHLLSGARLLAVAALTCVLIGGHLGLESRRLTQTLLLANQLTPPAEAEADPANAEADDAPLLQRIAQQQALHDMLARTDERPRHSAALLRDVVAALPERVWLTEIDLLGAQGLRIAGASMDSAGLRAFAARLGHVEALRGVPIDTLRIEPQLAGDSVDERSRLSVQSFVLASATYRAPQQDAQ